MKLTGRTVEENKNSKTKVTGRSSDTSGQVSVSLVDYLVWINYYASGQIQKRQRGFRWAGVLGKRSLGLCATRKCKRN